MLTAAIVSFLFSPNFFLIGFCAKILAVTPIEGDNDEKVLEEML